MLEQQIDELRVDRLMEALASDQEPNHAHQSGRPCPLCSLADKLQRTKLMIMADNCLIALALGHNPNETLREVVTMAFITGMRYEQRAEMDRRLAAS